MKKVIRKAKQLVVVVCALTLLASPVFIGQNFGPTAYRMSDVWLIGGL
ncbi:hypothetical protein LZ578_00790 [Jeotgalibaca sp. MA1X17-3]|nr:hypothetical protein [Jeotgalibaca sp. MA1X17-3]UJF15770.1 hypothetical protein LZ578_00790 [Jeotgalibaca sp. MA1X17-3]